MKGFSFSRYGKIYFVLRHLLISTAAVLYLFFNHPPSQSAAFFDETNPTSGEPPFHEEALLITPEAAEFPDEIIPGEFFVYLPLLFYELYFPPPLPETILVCGSVNLPLPIPDNDPVGLKDTITITDMRYIHDLNIYLNVRHSWVGDLEIRLIHEGAGTQVALIDRPGYPTQQYGCSGDNIITILDDEASQPVEHKCAASIPSISGSFQPNEVLESFNGIAINGSWTLTIIDHQKNDTGSLVEWCLESSVSAQPPSGNEPSEPLPIPPTARIDNITGKNQALPLDCESRSAVDWAAYFGASIGELDFFNHLPKTDDPDTGFVGNVYGAWGQIPPNPYGVHAVPVAELLRAYGVEAYAYRGISWDAVRREVSAHRPVIVWVIGSSNGVLPGRFYPVFYTSSTGNTTVVSPYQHTAIVIGYTEDQVTLLDGAKIYTRSLTQFLDSWSVLRNMAVMAVP